MNRRCAFCFLVSLMMGSGWATPPAQRIWHPVSIEGKVQNSVRGRTYEVKGDEAVMTDRGQTDLARYVDPFVGTGGTGHTTPAACVPLGMVQAGPDTGTGTWDYCGGYRYGDGKIVGFSQTHINGTGRGDLGDIRILPFTGRAVPDGLAYGKSSEKASPGSYSVALDGCEVDVAAAAHASIYRIRYTGSGPRRLLVDCQWGIVSYGKVSERVVESESKPTTRGMTGWNRINQWVDRRCAYAVRFDRDCRSCERLPLEEGNKAYRYVFDFGEDGPDTLIVKIALSANSTEAAERNLAAEIPHWDIEDVAAKARQAWNDILNVATIEGAEAEKRNWYTSLYHLYAQPNNIADAGDAVFYTTFSCWDMFRAAGPLYTVLTPGLALDFVDSMLEQGRRTGFLPIWTLWGVDNQCMIGTHSVPMIVDACLKGLGGAYDSRWREAYRQIRDTLTVRHENRDKEEWEVYDRYGYYPFDLIRGESVSRTLECAYDDWCAARMAERFGTSEEVAFFQRRAGYWRNVLDPALGTVRGKDSSGRWREPFDPFALGHGADTANDFTEGNAFQYTWHVMHDPRGLIAALGGTAEFTRRLDALFSQPTSTVGMGTVLDVTGLIGQYVHGNEPSHHVIYFYPQIGRPDAAAERIREVFDRFYLPKPDGLCGNDDCGQMSAWYLFSAMGFYPFNPCGGDYILGAPQVPRVTVRLAGGKTFTVIARGLSRENKYVRSITLNGRRITGCVLRHADILAGGELVFEMRRK